MFSLWKYPFLIGSFYVDFGAVWCLSVSVMGTQPVSWNHYFISVFSGIIVLVISRFCILWFWTRKIPVKAVSRSLVYTVWGSCTRRWGCSVDGVWRDNRQEAAPQRLQVAELQGCVETGVCWPESPRGWQRGGKVSSLLFVVANIRYFGVWCWLPLMASLTLTHGVRVINTDTWKIASFQMHTLVCCVSTCPNVFL